MPCFKRAFLETEGVETVSFDTAFFDTVFFETDRPLLILDIDETLLYAAPAPLAASNQKRSWDHKTQRLWIYKRPFVDEFLAQCSRYYQLAIWTSARASYAEEVVTQVFPMLSPLFVLSEQHCVLERHASNPSSADSAHTTVSVKPLSLLTPALHAAGSSLSRVLMLDDSPEKHYRHLDNLIPIPPYRGQSNDRDLLYLWPYLKRIAACSDFLSLPKHNWRQHVCVDDTVNDAQELR